VAHPRLTNDVGKFEQVWKNRVNNGFPEALSYTK